MMRRYLGFLLGSGILVYASTVSAQPIPLGEEFQVNTTVSDEQGDAAVAMDTAGNSIVVWESDFQDGSDKGVFAQRYDSAGMPVGVEFQVNTFTTDEQLNPDVAIDGAGNAVVVWESVGQDSSGKGIFAQRYDSAGIPLGTEFQVNTVTTGDQSDPAVAMDAAGNILVVWESVGQDGMSKEIVGQRYDSLGMAVGAEFQVNTVTMGQQNDPAVAMDSMGNAVVVWESVGPDRSGKGVFAQRYDSAGMPVGTEFQVNTVATGDQSDPDVAMDSLGNVIVVWASDNQDGSDEGIFGQRYDSAGMPVRAEFQVNTFTADDQSDPAVAMDDAGNALVVWESGDQDGSDDGVFAQRYDSLGVPVGGEFQVNTFIRDEQGDPDVAMDGGGNALVVWESDNQDGSDEGVFAQRYQALP